MRLALGIPREAPDVFHDLGQTGSVAGRQRMLTPDPFAPSLANRTQQPWPQQCVLVRLRQRTRRQ